MFHPPHALSQWTEKLIIHSSPLALHTTWHRFTDTRGDLGHICTDGSRQGQGSWTRGARASGDLDHHSHSPTVQCWAIKPWSEQGLSAQADCSVDAAMSAQDGKLSVLTFKELGSACWKAQLIRAKLLSMMQRSGCSDEESIHWAFLFRQGLPFCMYLCYLFQALFRQSFCRWKSQKAIHLCFEL